MHLEWRFFESNQIKTFLGEVQQNVDVKFIDKLKFIVNAKVDEVFGSIIEYCKSKALTSVVSVMHHVHRHDFHCT